MKRSDYVVLALMGGVAFYMVAGGSDDVEANTYASIGDCIAGGNFDQATCEAAFAEAGAERLVSAPRYASRDDCEAEFGVRQCQEAIAPDANGGGSSVFLPAFAGFMLGRAVGSFAAQPLYSRGGKYYTGGGHAVGPARSDAPGVSRKVAADAAAKPRPATRTMSRGGFGAKSAAIASRASSRSFGG